MFDFLLGNDVLSAILAFLIVLIPAVLIHELGHFLAAKSVGISILEFGIGMPPRMVRLFRYQGTDYTLNWLPLGGFVRPLGEDIVRQHGDEEIETDRDEALKRGIAIPKSVGEVRPLARIWFMAAGALANFLMAFVLFVIIALSGLPTMTGVRVIVQYVDPAGPLGTAGLLPGDALEAIDGDQFLTTDELAAQLAARAGQPVTLTVAREGMDGSFPLEFTPAGFDGQPTQHPFIRGVADESPAQQAGIQPGDLVVAFNDDPLTAITDLQTRTRQFLDQEVTLTLWRDGETQTVILTPRANPPEGQGAMGIQIGEGSLFAEAGLAYAEGPGQMALVPLNLGDSVRYSLDRIGGVFNSIFSIPGQILQGTAQPEQLRLTSPLGISQVGGLFLQDSIERGQPAILLEFVALISIALGFTNLLPIPALDGGRILFVLIEMVRGRPIAPEREGMVHLIGLVVLLSLMAVVLVQDIRDPITNLIR